MSRSPATPLLGTRGLLPLGRGMAAAATQFHTSTYWEAADRGAAASTACITSLSYPSLRTWDKGQLSQAPLSRIVFRSGGIKDCFGR